MPEPTAVLAPERYRLLSGSALKVIAVITMLVDHVTALIIGFYPEFNEVLFTVNTTDVHWRFILRTVGRLAFPIFCFLLVEGFVHTRNRKSYGRNLALFAIASEVPFDLARSLKPWDPTYQNVFFTLFIGYLGLCALEYLSDRLALQTVCVVGLAILSSVLLCDYGASGYALILILYLLRQHAVAKAALGCCVTSATWRAGLAFIPINLYNGTRGFIKGPVLKFVFYAFYPVHMLILWQVRLQLGV